MRAAPDPGLGVVVAFSARGGECATRNSLGAHAVGYARHAVPGSALAALVNSREAFGCSAVYSDAVPGAAIFKPGLDAALAALSPGSVLAVASLALLTWRSDELRSILHTVGLSGAHVLADAEGLDSRQPATIFDFAGILDAYEVNVRAARRLEARLDAADGRVRITDEAWREIAPLIARGQMSVTQAATALGVARSSVYRRMEA